VNANNRDTHTEARKNQEAARALIDQGNKHKAAITAANVYELARKAYGD
jgi:hypothetical protein